MANRDITRRQINQALIGFVINAMANGEIDMAMCWNDAAVALKRDGYPVRLAAPKEGMITWVCGLVMTNVGKADEALVYDALNSLLAPETVFGEPFSFSVTVY